MKTIFLFFRTLLILAMCGVLLHAAEVLTQQDVIKLLELKIPEQTIIDKVKESGTAFVLGTGDIERLKKAGASDALIAAMQGTGSVPTAGNPASEITDLALIVDYSGSMNAKMKDGATKVVSAKKCVNDLIEKLPNDLNVALVVYGTSKKRGCEDIDIVQPLGPIDKAALKSKIIGFNATGMTPIATSLTKAGEELKKAKGGSAIVLVTDGAESCHGDPAGVAAKLAAEFGVKFGINVIGFGIEPKEKAELADIAAKGHGKLLTVENASELAGALQKVVAEKVATPAPTPVPTATPTPTPTPSPTPTPRATKEYEAGGQAIKPGVFFGDAPMVKSGDYKGELAMKEAKFYQVTLHKGQELRAIGIIQKGPYETAYNRDIQTFVVAIYNKDLSQVARETVAVPDSPHDPATVRATWTAESDGPAYIAIAASYNEDKHESPYEPGDPKNPKPSAYTLKIKIEGESTEEPAAGPAIARMETAGGAGLDAAPELKAPALVTSDLKIGETAFYKFAVKKGDPVQISAAIQKPFYAAMASGGIHGAFTLTLYDDDQVQVAQKKIDVQNNPPDPKSLSVSWPATTSGNAFVSVSAINSGGDIYPASFQPSPGRFSLQVTTGGGSPTPGTESEKSNASDQPAESVSPAESAKPAETPKPAKTKKPADPFAGAESTPG
ncbi:MAG: vWA domain-containing protein [Chthoniobacterales bacterium]